MSAIYAEEAIRLFQSYGFRVDESSVREWVKENNEKANRNPNTRPIEDDLHRYNDWCRVKGTAHEEGIIDDTTKIARLLAENSLLKREVETLKDEKQQLEDLSGQNDWIWK